MGSCSSTRNYLTSQPVETSTNTNSSQNQNAKSSFRILQILTSRNETSRPIQPNSASLQTHNVDDSRSIITSQQTTNVDSNRLKINWSNILVNASRKEECLLGQSSHGAVIKAIWKKNNREIDVAIKFLTKSNALVGDNSSSFEDLSAAAWKEVGLMKEAENCLADSDCIVKAFGIAEGPLPERIAYLFGLPSHEEGVGIIMRYEGGGSLKSLLYSNMKPTIPIFEKIRILTGVAKGLVELHSSGIIHADIKSGNVLLSHHNPPEIRLADFGMSLLRNPTSELGATSLLMTASSRRISVYSAPETLLNPFKIGEYSVAQASRKTDMYSFGILAWEILARKRPFHDVKNETMLCGKVHRGERPPLDQIPADTPPELISMIECCWDEERSKRKSAVECLSILQYNLDLLSTGHFDVFFSHAWVDKPLLCHVYHTLTKLGYRVWYDQTDMGHDIKESTKRGIASSKVVIACVNPTYQSRDTCIFELREANATGKPIVSLVTEDDPLTWATPEVQDLCKLKSRLYVNICDVAKWNWKDDQGITPEMLTDLSVALEPLSKLLEDLNCSPSLINKSRRLSNQISARFSFQNP